MQAFAWAEQHTMGVIVGALNDDEEEQDDDDPSGTQRVDRGASEQFGERLHFATKDFGQENSADARILDTQWGSGGACGEITGSGS